MTVRRSLGLSLLQRYCSLGISFLGTVIISRLISPADLGIYFTSAAILMIAGTLSQLGIGVYIVQEKKLSRELIRSAFGILLVSSVSVACLVFLLRHEIAALFREPGVAEVLTIIALTFLVTPFNTPCYSLLQRRMRFDLLFAAGVTGSLVNVVTAVLLAIWGYSYMSLAWAALFEQISLVIFAMVFVPRDIWVRPSLSRWRHIFNVGGTIMASSFLGQIGLAAPHIALGRGPGFDAVGIFVRGKSLYDLFTRGFLQGLTPVLLPAFSEIARSGGSLAKPVVLTYTLLGAFAWPFFALLGIFALPIVRLLYGAQWHEAASIVQIICIIGVTVPISAYVSDVLFAIGRSRLWLWMQAFTQALKILLVILGASFSLHAVAWALVIAEAASLIIALAALRHAAGLRLVQLAIPTAQNGVVTAMTLAGPVGLILLAGEQSPLGDLLVLAASSPLMVGGWLVGLYFTGHPLMDELHRVRNLLWRRS